MVETNFKQREIGMIPEDWKHTSFGDIFKIRHGRSQKEVENSNGKYPIYGTGGLMGYATNYLYNKESVLIGRKGTIDKPRYLDTPFWTVDTLFFTEIFKNYCPKFIYYLFQTIDWYSYNEASGVPSLNARTIESIERRVPELKEQQAIASALSDADAWIESLEKLIAKKRLIKQGAMQELLIPKEDWEVKKLGDFGQVLIGLTYSPNDVREHGTLVLRSSNVQNNKLAFENNVFVEMDLPSRVIVQENDLLICVRNGSRDLIGKCALIDKKTSGQAFGAFMSIFRSENNGFIFHLFQSSIIQKQIEENLGATINQITNKMLKNFEVFVPESNEQIRIANILSDMDAEIDALEQKLQKAQQIKQGMMQQLLTGKIRLIKNKAGQPKEIVTAS